MNKVIDKLCILTSIYQKPALENSTGMKLKTLIVLLLRDYFCICKQHHYKFFQFSSFPNTLNKTVNESSKDD